MITFALLALQETTLSFNGGSVEHLADTLMKQADVPVIAIASEKATLPAAKCSDKTKVTAWSKFADQLGLEFSDPKAPHNLGFKSIPLFQNPSTPADDRSYLKQWSEAIEFLPGDLPKKDRRNVSATLAVKNLNKLKLGKGVSAHWALADYVVVVRGTDRSSRQLLEAIADAVGGKVVETTSRYRLDIDPKAIRRRFSEQFFRLNQIQNFGERHRYSMLAKADIVRRATDEQIIRAFKDSEGHAFIDLPRNSDAIRYTLRETELARQQNLPSGTLVDVSQPIVGVIYNYWSVSRRFRPLSGNIPIEF